MLTTDNTVLLVIDVQERLSLLMHEHDVFFKNLMILIKGAQILNLPLIVTEQAPEKIGRTIPELTFLLHKIELIEKISFSCCDSQEFVQKITSLNRKNVLLTGLETHVCIYQTALDLLRMGFIVHVVVDAVSSRTLANKEIGLQRIKSAGGSLTSTETVLCEILRKAEGEAFKEILKLIK